MYSVVICDETNQQFMILFVSFRKLLLGFLHKKTTQEMFLPQHKQWQSFLIPSEFMCDCSTIWSKPIYSQRPASPPPPCSLKVTPGDFGEGVLELCCHYTKHYSYKFADEVGHCEVALHRFPALQHEVGSYAFLQNTGCVCTQLHACPYLQTQHAQLLPNDNKLRHVVLHFFLE